MTPLDPSFLTKPLAHRGLHDAQQGCIENSPLAFRAAANADYGIELDVQISADGIAMAFHDYSLERLTSQSSLVNARSASDLGKITLTGSNDTIPTLKEVLNLVNGQVPLLIEIKDQSYEFSAQNIGRLEQAIAGDLDGYNGPVAVMSFNPLSVAEFAKHAPNACIGLTTGAFWQSEYPNVAQSRLDELQAIKAFDPTKHAFISHYAPELPDAPVAKIKTQGKPILCWTIRSPEQEAQARTIADNVTFEGYPAKAPRP